MYILQNLVFPNMDINTSEDLYLRVNNNCFISKKEKKIYFLREGGECSFDTYYNSFSVGVWNKKTIVENISLKLKGKGKFLTKVLLNKIGTSSIFIYDSIIDIDGEVDLFLGKLSDFKTGMLFFQLKLISTEGEVNEGYYYTEDIPNHNVKLGIVITHFNRKNYVLPAVKRINDRLLLDDYYSSNISLVIVDNSSNITKQESLNAILISNKNLGGSGGFTRGLLYLKDNSYTHCLFMDDDASCEIESIKRTYALLQFASQNKFAISGGLISETFTNVLREKGAVLADGVIPLHSGSCVSHVNELLLIEDNCGISPNYGAWWFFAFNISDVVRYPFPFFVRGDDILFGVLNKFNISTMNGIACWGEEFSLKESPMTRYLGMRGELVARLLSSNLTMKKMLIAFLRRYLSSLFSYNYSSAEAIRMAIYDILSGPDVFTSDMDASKAREKIYKLQANEKLDILDLDTIKFKKPIFNTSKFNKIYRFITLNGFLLPSFFLKDDVIFQPKGFRAIFRQIFRYKKVLYWSVEYQKGYISEHNKKNIARGIILGIKTLIDIFIKYNDMKSRFLEKKDYLTSEDFWRKVYFRNKE